MSGMSQRSTCFTGAACALVLTIAGCSSSPPPRAVAPAPVVRAVQTETFEQRLLADHNAERDRKGLPRLAWSDQLAQHAKGWADKLARDDRMVHSDRKDRPGEGENLWSGTAGHYNADDMVGAFLSERKAFKAGTFPDVSKTGKWQDVGHYSQIIWPTTTALGCALAHNKARDYLVCRYSPAGNVFGHAVG
jgi:uncharacterized protein YkwD